MTKVCLESKYLTSLKSNVVHIGNLIDDQYNCPEGLCAELGSLARPAQTFSEAFLVISKRYSNETPVTILLSPGEYSSGTSSKSLTFPKNVVGVVCLLGTAILKSDIIVYNLNSFDMQNIHLKGDLQLLADGNHIGEMKWKSGTLEGKYVYSVADKAEQSFTMENVKQFYQPSSEEDLYDNAILVTGNGNASIQKAGCFLSSPLKGKLIVSDDGKLNRQIENCSVLSGGETSEFDGFAEFDDTYKDNKLETHKDAKDFDIFYDFVNDFSKISKIWTMNNVTAKVSKGKSLFKKEIMGKSSYNNKSVDSTFHIQGEGMFHTMEIKEEAKSFLDSTRTTLNIPEGEGHSSITKAYNSSFLYTLLHEANTNTPLRTPRKELNDKVRKITSGFNSRTVSAGYDTHLRGDSSYTQTISGSIMTSGAGGFKGFAAMSENSNYKRTETNVIKILLNKIDENIHNIFMKDRARASIVSSGGERTSTIRKSDPSVGAWFCNVVQMNDSKCNYSANDKRRRVKGGSMVKHVLNDSSEFNVVEQNGDCKGHLPFSDNALYSLTTNHQSKAQIRGGNNFKQITGGTISEIVQNDSSIVDIVSRAASVHHDSLGTSYVVKIKDRAKHTYKGTTGEISSSTRQQNITTLGSSEYVGTYSNNVLKASVLVSGFAEQESKHICQSDGQELIGDTFYEGPIVSKTTNASQTGKINNKAGSHTWSNSRLEGPLETIGGEFISNLSFFKNILENINSKNTALKLNNTSFVTSDSANIKSTAIAQLVKLDAKLCSFENTDANVGHLMLIHGTDTGSCHRASTGICATTSKKLITTDNPEKVKANFTESFHNDQRDPIFAEVGELVQYSNSVQVAESNEATPKL